MAKLHWYSGEYFEPGAAADFQATRTGKPAAWFYRLTGYDVKCDGFRQTLNQVLEVKNNGYAKLLQEDWFRNSESGGEQLVKQARKQLQAARAHGMKNVWEVQGKASADAIRRFLSQKGVPTGPGAIEVIPIPE